MPQTTNSEYQEVHFFMYCEKCKHYDKDSMTKAPCNDCLNHPINLYSHKPVYFVEAEK